MYSHMHIYIYMEEKACVYVFPSLLSSRLECPRAQTCFLSVARKQRPAQQDVYDRLQAAGRDGGDGGTGGKKRDFYRFNLILMFFGVLVFIEPDDIDFRETLHSIF